MNHIENAKAQIIMKKNEKKNKRKIVLSKKELDKIQGKVFLDDKETIELIAKFFYGDRRDKVNREMWVNIVNKYPEMTVNQIFDFRKILMNDESFPFKIPKEHFRNFFETILYDYIAIWIYQDDEKEKLKKINGKYATFIIKELYNIKNCSSTKLQQTWFRDYETSKSSKIVIDRKIARALYNLEKKGYIIFIEKKTFSYYKLSDNIKKIEDNFYYRKEK